MSETNNFNIIKLLYYNILFYGLQRNNRKLVRYGSQWNKHETNIKKSEEFSYKRDRKLCEKELIIDTKLDNFSSIIETRDWKAEAGESQARQNQNNLTIESTALQEKQAEQAMNVH